MNNLVLSLFPGIGLLDMAFEEEGFCIVRGPDCLWGGDIRRFYPPSGCWGGLIAGPPCQTFSSLAHLVRANGHEPKFGNLIPEFERCVAEAGPDWFLMENVRAAPEPMVADYQTKSFLLDNSALDSGDGYGNEQRRLRRFTFGLRGRAAPDLRKWIDLAVFLLPDAEKAVFGDGHPTRQEVRHRRQAVLSDPSAVPVKIGGSGKVKRTAVSGGGGGGGPGRPDSCKGVVTSNVGGRASRYRLADALRLQGLPENFLKDAPFTAEGKLKAVANGVALPTGRAIAKAVKEALDAAPAPE